MPCCVGYVLIFLHTGKKIKMLVRKEGYSAHILVSVFLYLTKVQIYLYCYTTTFPCSPCHKRGILSYCGM